MTENNTCWLCRRTEEQERQDFKQIVIDSDETDGAEKDALRNDTNLHVLPKADDAANFITIPIRTEVRRKLCDGYLQFKGEFHHIDLPLCTVCASIVNHIYEQLEVV